MKNIAVMATCTSLVLFMSGCGGGGGSRIGGGGGAGGYLANGAYNHAVTAKNYDITIGTGGAGGDSQSSGVGGQGTNGSDSSFDTITSTGGGGGGRGGGVAITLHPKREPNLVVGLGKMKNHHPNL